MRPSARPRSLPWLLALAFGLFVVGVFAPMMSLKKLLLFENRFSVFSGLMHLWHAQHHALFGVILLFSIVFPLGKIAVLYLVWRHLDRTGRRLNTLFHWLAVLGKWSMLDVFVVAVLVVVGQFRGLAHIEVHYGLYVFAGAVLLLQIVTFRLDSLRRRRRTGPA